MVIPSMPYRNPCESRLVELESTLEEILAQGDQALDEGDGDGAWCVKASLLGAEEQCEASLEASAAALHVDPRLADAWLCKGRALGRTGELETSLDHLRRAIELDPVLSAEAAGELAQSLRRRVQAALAGA